LHFNSIAAAGHRAQLSCTRFNGVLKHPFYTFPMRVSDTRTEAVRRPIIRPCAYVTIGPPPVRRMIPKSRVNCSNVQRAYCAPHVHDCRLKTRRGPGDKMINGVIRTVST
jgi:hypothetical protein